MPPSTRMQAYTRAVEGYNANLPDSTDDEDEEREMQAEEAAEEAAVSAGLRAEADAQVRGHVRPRSAAQAEADEEVEDVEEEDEEEGTASPYSLPPEPPLSPPELELEPFPPPGLKEISSLASWTVSTAKPGNGVAALRNPDTALFWQSDGPQPHLLSIHFFKLVSIVHMRIYLDFESDESYTPTKIQFLAGMGVHDIQEFAEMSFEQPTGWIDVDFSNVGPVDLEVEELEQATGVVQWARRPVLRAFLVQVRILENHQNGKDTHLRAVQLFARDEGVEGRETRSVPRREENWSQVRPTKKTAKKGGMEGIKLAPWMMEPEIR